MRTSKTIFIGGALAASLAVLLAPCAGCTPLFWSQWLGAILLGFGLAWSTIHIHSLPLKLVVAALALLETAVLAWLLQMGGIPWSPQPALLAGLLAASFGLACSLSKEGRRKQQVGVLFLGRVSHDTFQKLLASQEPLPCAGEKREASVMDCQLSNRQELSGRLSAPDFVALTHAFFGVATQALMDSGGVLAGSCPAQPRALFGAPLADPAHATQAQEAARLLAERLQPLHQMCRERWNAEMECKVSIHFGAMILGVFSSGGFDAIPAGEQEAAAP